MKRSQLFMVALALLSMLMFSVRGFGQSVRITGTVTDPSGASITGVQVIDDRNPSNVAITDAQGRYQLSGISPQGSLTISFLGYESQTVVVGNRTVVDVTLQTDDIQIDDVVVIGYGTQRRSDVTGAIVSVSATDLENRSTSDAAAALQGKAAGVHILNIGGSPGEGASIRVRGYSSNSGNLGPLLIVDGLKVDNIQYLDPSMIESMEVLKDAASAAIYGAEAGNGVVLITTKRGKQGSSRIFYNYQHTISSLGRIPQVMNAAEYIQYNKEAGRLTDAILAERDYDGTDTNWAKEVFVRGVSQRHTVGMEGANDRGSYFMSINNISDNGMMRGDYDVYKRLTAQLNADYKIKPWLTSGVNLSIEKWSIKSPSQRNEFASSVLSTVINDPLTPVYWTEDQLPEDLKTAIAQGKNVMKGENGLYYATSKYQDNDSGSPFIQRDRAAKNINQGLSTRGTAYINLMPLQDLVITSRMGFRFAQNYSSTYTFPYYANVMAKEDNYNLTANSNSSIYYNWENFANYNKRIGKHDMGAMIGMSYMENRTYGVRGGGSGPDPLSGYDDNFLYLDYLNTSATRTINGAPGQSTSLSYFGRLSYTYADRYIIQANFRADAFDSSKLPADKRWGYFPSVSVGWTLSNEAFFQYFANMIKMDQLKLRASWGRNGNINVLNNYRYNSTIALNGRVYQWVVGDPTATTGSMPSGLVNPNLRWESSDQMDIGLDARFLNNRLNFTVDYFDKRTKDLLVSVRPPLEVGVESVTMNAGEISNKGFEFEAGWRDRAGDFRYSINANFATLKNKVTYVDPTAGRVRGTGFAQLKTSTYFEEGYPLWYINGYKFTGVDDATGDPTFLDVDSDGVIGDADLVDLGSGMPDYTYGMTVNLAYKGFDLTLFGMGVGGNEIYSYIHRTDRPMTNAMSKFFKERWTENNKTASLPRPGGANEYEFWSSSANVFNGSYFKIKQIQLGYSIPESVTRKVMVSNLRVYVSLDDFVTITKYPGFDPEVASSNTTSGLGLDMGSFPISKKILFGVNISF